MLYIFLKHTDLPGAIVDPDSVYMGCGTSVEYQAGDVIELDEKLIPKYYVVEPDLEDGEYIEFNNPIPNNLVKKVVNKKCLKELNAIQRRRKDVLDDMEYRERLANDMANAIYDFEKCKCTDFSAEAIESMKLDRIEVMAVFETLKKEFNYLNNRIKDLIREATFRTYKISKELKPFLVKVLERDQVPFSFPYEGAEEVSVALTGNQFHIAVEDAICEKERSYIPVYSLRTIRNQKKLRRLVALNGTGAFIPLKKDIEKVEHWQVGR
ncbi:hypothetical protein M2146_001094 [Lachnospiraceae bacterium PF1-22]